MEHTYSLYIMYTVMPETIGIPSQHLIFEDGEGALLKIFDMLH